MTSPNNNSVDSVAAPFDPCAAWQELYVAYIELISGRAVQQTRDGARWSLKHKGSVVDMKRELNRLEQLCQPHTARAVRVGPYYPSHFRPSRYG